MKNVFFVSEPGRTPSTRSIKLIIDEIDANIGLGGQITSITGSRYNDPNELADKLSARDMIVVINQGGAGYGVINGRHNVRQTKQKLLGATAINDKVGENALTSWSVARRYIANAVSV